MLGKAQVGYDNIAIAQQLGSLSEVVEHRPSVEDKIHVDMFEVDENVGELEVPVDDIEVVDGLEALDDLTHKVPSFFLREPAPQLQQLLQVAAVAVLHKQIEVVHCLLDVVQFNHVWVLYARQNSDLLLQVLLESRIQVDFLDDLASHPLVPGLAAGG